MWLATDSDEVVKVAWAEPLRATLAANVLAPSVKVTVPVGVPAPGATAATVAVKVTVWPNTDAFGAELTVVLLEASLTTWGEVESLPASAP